MIIDDAGGLVFRPPSEARSFILRVTIGCSHNTCRFCNMYKASEIPHPSPLKKSKGSSNAVPKPCSLFIRRIFLADGDAMVLPTDTFNHNHGKMLRKVP